LSDFRATISFVHVIGKAVLIPVKRDGEREVKKTIQDASTNERNLEVIRQFDNGNCRVSSIDEIVKIAKNGTYGYAFKVEFNTANNLDIQEVIERFNAIFVFKGISEVGKN
jgi:hypothetical protein